VSGLKISIIAAVRIDKALRLADVLVAAPVEERACHRGER
jgi:hypothetical protein